MKSNYQNYQVFKNWFLNKKIILTGVIILSVCLTAFVNNNKTDEPKTESKQVFQNIDKWYKAVNRSTDSVHNPKWNYEVRGKYSRPVKKEKLINAGSLIDIIELYPTSWISVYKSVEIISRVDGKSQAAKGKNEILNTKQKNILNKIEIGNEVEINVNYSAKNPVTGQFQNHTMHVVYTVIPEKEAAYLYSKLEMENYFNKNIGDKIFQGLPLKNQKAAVYFKVNEEGKITDANIAVSSGNAIADKQLIEGILKMPKWKPAENDKGEKVKQEFIFNIGNANVFSGDGC